MKKRLFSLLTTLALLLALAPAAFAAEAPGAVFATPNGDGQTPFNLQWMDMAKGIVSFEKQITNQNYRLELYRDGVQVSAKTVGNRDGKTSEQVSIADDLTQSGTYVFTLHRCEVPGTSLAAGQVAKSEPMVYTMPDAVLGAPTNLRFEVANGKVTCAWDAPANWVDGRDFFLVQVKNSTTDWGVRSISLPGNRYDINFSSFVASQYGGPSTADGSYSFSVRSVSGDMTAIRSAADFTVGTVTYSHPDGAITNSGAAGTPPAPAAKTAYMREQAITIDGKAVTFQTYALKDEKGNETNYVKLRDVAMQLNGTAGQFDVGWSNAVNIETGKAYVPNGTEMTTPFTGDRAYTDATAPTNINGAASDLAAIVLNDDKGAGYTYYKLRDLGIALGFKVDWSADKGITVDTK